MTPDNPQQVLAQAMPNLPGSPTPPLPFGSTSPTGSKPKAKSPYPTVLPQNASPSLANMGSKQLIGQ